MPAEPSQTPPAPPQPLAYNVPDAGRAIGVSKATIWRLIKAGELRTFKVGARTLIKTAVLLAFIDRKAATA